MLQDLDFNEPIKDLNNTKCEIWIVSETEEIVIDKALTNSFDISLDYVYG